MPLGEATEVYVQCLQNTTLRGGINGSTVYTLTSMATCSNLETVHQFSMNLSTSVLRSHNYIKLIYFDVALELGGAKRFDVVEGSTQDTFPISLALKFCEAS